MTYRNILKDGIDILNKNKIDNAEFDATEIMLNLIDSDKENFLLKADEDLEKSFTKNYISDLINKFDNLISYRANHYPLQYILGEAYFLGFKFNVDESVLIPRFDTESLVEKVLEDNNDKNKFVLDLCTGSGCIAISLAKLGGYKTVVASDISLDCLNIASNNANELLNETDIDDEMKQHIYFLQSDLYDNFDKIKEKTGIEKFDIITCNPPYIKTKDIDKLDEEVKRFEPKIALDGDKDGLKYYKRLAKDTKKFLNENGKIYLEIGFDQADDVTDIFKKEKYKSFELIKDLSGNDRVIVVGI